MSSANLLSALSGSRTSRAAEPSKKDLKFVAGMEFDTCQGMLHNHIQSLDI
jgi:hypothetical protein